MDPIIGVDPTISANGGGEEVQSFADSIKGSTAAEMEEAMAEVLTLPIMLDVVMDGIQEFDE